MASALYTCVGSGTCVPSASRGPACHLLEAGELRILIDLGTGSLRALAARGKAIASLNAVGVTHRHQDHVADLLPLVFALKYSPGAERTEPLNIFGYSGIQADLKRLAEIFGSWVLDPGFPLRVHEPARGGLRLAAGRSEAYVTAHSVDHSPEAVGFRIRLFPEGTERCDPLVFAYSGDSGPTAALVDLASEADLFVCECAFPDGQGVRGHLTPSELLPICSAAAPRLTVATHFYPAWDRRGVDRLWQEALWTFGEDLRLVAATDGLRVDLREARTC